MRTGQRTDAQSINGRLVGLRIRLIKLQLPRRASAVGHLFWANTALNQVGRIV